MKDVLVQLLKNLYINQNFIWLIFLFIGVCFAHCYKICFLCKITSVIFFVVGLSVVSSTIVYAIEYWARKWYKAKKHKLNYIEERRKMGVKNQKEQNALHWLNDLLKRICKNKYSLIFSISSLLLLTFGQSLPHNLGPIVGVLLGVIAILINLYSSDIYWEEYD